MDVSVKQQTVFFLLSIFMGIILGIIADFIRILRYEFKANGIKSILDIIFILISSMLFTAFLYSLNGIQLRFYILLGLILGIILHFCVFGSLVRHIFRLNIKFLKTFLKILLKPAVILCIIVNKLFKLILKFLNRIKKFICRFFGFYKEIIRKLIKRIKRV